MNVGILGAGAMGSTHARAFAKVAGVQVAAVSSRNLAKAQTLADAVGEGAVATTDDLAIIRDPNIDAVAITLPTHLHKPLTLAALQAGKPVLLEKPFALNVPDCDAMLTAQAQTGTLLMIGHTLRFWPEYVALEKFIKSNALGKPMAAMATRLSQLPAWASWFTNPELSGGAVLDLMVHDLDALNWLFGTPKTVYARGHQAKPKLWNHIMATLDYGDMHGFAEGSLFMPEGYPFTMTLKVVCEQGVIEFGFKASGVSVDMGSVSSLMAYQAGRATPIAVEPGDAYENQITYFVDCVRNKRAPQRGTPEQARLAVACSNAACESLETGRLVELAAFQNYQRN